MSTTTDTTYTTEDETFLVATVAHLRRQVIDALASDHLTGPELEDLLDTYHEAGDDLVGIRACLLGHQA